jgi:protein translocase SecG subunit
MMTLLVGFLTLILVLNCLFLILLILIQLPKKEAGAGIAFGGAATDALFGAGSGNALTKMTKYSGTIFVVLSITLSILNAHRVKEGDSLLEKELKKKAGTVVPGAPASRTSTPTQPATTNPESPVVPAPTGPTPVPTVAPPQVTTNPAASPAIQNPPSTNPADPSAGKK